jgi:hypothetical protein
VNSYPAVIAAKAADPVFQRYTGSSAKMSDGKCAKSSLASMVNRVLTSPYLWWFDPFKAGLDVRSAASNVLAL